MGALAYGGETLSLGAMPSIAGADYRAPPCLSSMDSFEGGVVGEKIGDSEFEAGDE